MNGLPAILALGIVLGMRHATDPDHVIAVTTIVSGQRSVRRAALIGAAWGIGHTLTILVVGGGIILFKWAIPPRVGLGMELAVAVMLIVLGVINLGGTTPLVRLDTRLGVLAPYRLVRPLVVGIVHGLAGSAAVALLVLTAIRTPSSSVLYLLIFGIGTIAGMSLITAAVGIPFALAGPRFAGFQRHLHVTAGVISLGFGLVVAYQIGIVGGLFVG